ncbi:MAG: LamG domain-containing protein [Lentisphaerae bacterium]|nr:LamG domain-containing protein [Lentisphaerota bacterium]
MKACLPLVAAVLPLAVVAAPFRFPGFGWGEAKVERRGNYIAVNGPDGRNAFTIYTAKRTPLPDSLVVSNTADALVIDASGAFRAGLESLTLRSCDIDADIRLKGLDAVLRSTIGGPRGYSVTTLFAGKDAGDKFFATKSDIGLLPVPVERDDIQTLPDFRQLYFRWDFAPPKDGVDAGPVVFKGFKFGSLDDLPSRVAPRPGRSALRTVFHLPFEGSADAATGESARPIAERGIEYVRGHHGMAVHMTAKANSRLEYHASGNVDAETGTVTFWYKADWLGPLDKDSPWRTVFSLPAKGAGRGIGFGAVKCWFWGSRFRGDLDDLEGHYTATWRNELSFDGKWHHYAFSWGPAGAQIFRDGKRLCKPSLGYRPPTTYAAKRPREPFEFVRGEFPSFLVGCGAAGMQADGAIDDFRIWNRQMDEGEVAMCHAREANPYEAPPLAVGGDFGRRTLVAEARLDADGVARLKSEKRFRSEGEVNFRKLGGAGYLEATESRSRYFVRFDLDTDVPMYVFEIDYPDDRRRTADILVQRSANPHREYTTTCGYMTGDEYPVSGRMQTLRVLYWTSARDTAVVVMSPREDSPAAVSAIRVYRLDANALPVARVRAPAAPDGLGRVFGLHYEDISIGYNFATPATLGLSEDDMDAMMDRCAATMKFTGQNLLAYPGAWYGDLMCRDGYDPRHNHAPDYRVRWYDRFDREGLFFMPTVHAHDMPIDDGLLDRRSMRDGSLHGTPISILATGAPNQGGSHGSDPAFSFGHPQARSRIREIVGFLAREGAPHRSFKGIVMHMTRHCYLWWGSATSGYNDYCVDAFSKATGIAVPVDRKDPRRGKLYYEWLRANAWKRWIDWRCAEVTRFYAEIAKELANVRPDLLLVLDAFEMARVDHPRYLEDDVLAVQLREAGLDFAAVSAAAPNIVACLTTTPSNYRWRRDFRYPAENREALKAKLRVADQEPGYYLPLSNASRPAVHVHDVYWEDFVDYIHVKWRRPDDPALRIDGDGFADQKERVTVINPGGVHGMRQFAVPLARHDLVAITKGGFSVGTYGLEDRLVPFMQAFRALPPVMLADDCVKGSVVVRRGCWRGREYAYFVNSDWKPAKVSYDFGTGACDLVTGERHSGKGELLVGGYELKAFAWK